MIRPEIQKLVELGPFPSSREVDLDVIKQQEKLLKSIKPPVTDEEARQLLWLFGPDDYFGAAWTLVHLIETAPNWPLRDCLEGDANPWIVTLRESAKRADLL